MLLVQEPCSENHTANVASPYSRAQDTPQQFSEVATESFRASPDGKSHLPGAPTAIWWKNRALCPSALQVQEPPQTLSMWTWLSPLCYPPFLVLN